MSDTTFAPAGHVPPLALPLDAAPAPYTIRHLYTGADVRLAGVLTGADVTDALVAAARDEYLGGRRYVVFDCTAVDVYAISPQEMRPLAERADLYWALRPPLIAVVVVPQLEGYALARMWEVFADTQPVRTEIVRDRAAGLRWLAARGAADDELVAELARASGDAATADDAARMRRARG